MQNKINTMNLIGRKNEISQLQEYYNSGKSEFIAVYGRRRVGKTYLIDEFFDHKYTFSVSGILDGSHTEQMTAFVFALRKIGYQGKMLKTWLEAFYTLGELLEKKLVENERCTIFIDELPCFDTPRTNFIKAFGNFWNSWAQKHPQVMLIVCGSATTWMVKNIIDSYGGLHNRITHEMHLHPFSLNETEQMLQSMQINWDRLSILQIYMAIGGIPYYLSLLNKGESVTQAIDRLFFSENATLNTEYKRLFSSLFKVPEPYLEIIKILATNKKGISREDIVKSLNKNDNGHLTEYLKNLIKCDFVRYYYVKTKKVKKTDGLYQLVDFFTIFHNTFLTRPITDEHFWTHNLQTPLINTWLGLAFERVCMAHIPQIKRALGIDRIATEYYSWRSKESENGAQIDLLLERADRVINLIEIKYSNAPYTLTKEEDMKIRTRQSDFVTETGTKHAIFPTIITTFGLRENKYSGLIQSEITLDDLFKE
jgi:AAA+ ATPase superfamily predicted ATPase